MIDLRGVVADLRAERERAQKTIEQIDAALAALNGLGHKRSRTFRRRPSGKRTISAAARRRIAAAQRARWAKWKAAQKKS
jgi:hypothetical protein